MFFACLLHAYLLFSIKGCSHWVTWLLFYCPHVTQDSSDLKSLLEVLTLGLYYFNNNTTNDLMWKEISIFKKNVQWLQFIMYAIQHLLEQRFNNLVHIKSSITLTSAVVVYSYIEIILFHLPIFFMKVKVMVELDCLLRCF